MIYSDAYLKIATPILKWQWQNKYKTTNYYYDFKKDCTGLVNDILSFDTRETEDRLLHIAEQWKTFDDDGKMFRILEWIRLCIKYRRDINSWDQFEYWQTAQETLDKGTGDCEDGAILVYKLARAAGIPAWKLHLCIGDVQDPKDSTKTVGHCFLQYICLKVNDFITVDWCYWPDDSALALLTYQIASQNDKYQNIWVSFNEENMFARHDSIFINNQVPDNLNYDDLSK